MPPVDISHFQDVADSLGISSPSIVEKDYWATQLIGEISRLKPEGYQLIFSGGTCLAKAHQDTYRMSEDIDIKMVPDKNTCNSSKSQKKQKRQEIRELIGNAIESSKQFSCAKKSEIKNEGKYQNFQIKHPKTYRSTEALRPNLQLELTEKDLLAPPVQRPLSSLYANKMNKDPEVKSIYCDSIKSITSEKFVSLLRRTALHGRDSSRADDKTLIRHVYDLHLIRGSMEEPESLKAIVQKVIDVDQKQFGNQHQEFVNDAVKELHYGLSILLEQPHHRKRYDEFTKALVYHSDPAKWDQAIVSIQDFAKCWL